MTLQQLSKAATIRSMKIVVVGGGFAGVKAALELSKKQIGSITLISDLPYFLHHATLYSTATGKNDAESVIPLETIFEKHTNVRLIQDKIEQIDTDAKVLRGKHGNYHYDTAVLGLGSVTSYFNLSGMAKHAYGIKSLQEVTEFQDHIHDEVVRNKLDKEYFVIGAGPTGVEFAAALNIYLKNLKSLYRLKSTRSRVTIVEAAPRVLPTMSTTASRLSLRQLKKQGIRVLTNHKVSALADDTITIEGKSYSTRTAIWTSGVSNNPFFARNHDHFELTPQGRVQVNPYLQAAPDVYVIGDNSAIEKHHMALPAFRQAKVAAKNIARSATNRPLRAYKAATLPYGLPIGNYWGYVEWAGLYVSGFSGAIARRWLELYGLCQILPLKQALPVWRAHHLDEVEY